MKNYKGLMAFLLGVAVVFALGAKITTDTLRIGNGTNEDITLEFDIGNGALNPYIKWKQGDDVLQFSVDGVNVAEIGSGSGGGGGGINLLDNPGCEKGASTPDNWAASGGTFTRTTASGSIGFGDAACSWDSNGSAQTLIPDAVAVPNVLENGPCLAEIYYKAETITAGDYTLRAELDDGTDLSAELDLQPTDGAWRRAFVAFTCPEDDSVQLVVQSKVADADAILIDQTHLGSSKNDLLVTDPTEIVAYAYFANTASCAWSRTNTALGAFSTSAACPSITVANSSPVATINTADTDLPQIVFSSLPDGVYQVTANFVASSGAAPVTQNFSLFDGSTQIARNTWQGSSTNDNESFSLTGTFSHSGGAKTLAVNCSSASGSCTIDNDTGETQLSFTVIRYPSTSTSAVTLETQGWFLEGQWSGANPNLTTGDITSYTNIADGSLTLSKSPGSKDVGVACSGVNENTVGATTCSVGNEQLGIVFNAPYSGAYWVCADVNWRVSTAATGQDKVDFRWTRTPNNDDAPNSFISSNGYYNESNSGSTLIQAQQASPCAVMELQAGKTTLRLKYQQDVTNTVSTSELKCSNDAIVNARCNFRVVPFTQNFPQAIAYASLPDPTAVTEPSATANGLTQYFAESTGPTITNNVGTTTVIRGVFIPYKTSSGAWRVRFNYAFTSGTSGTNFTVTMSGLVFKNTASFNQSCSCTRGDGQVCIAFTNPGGATMGVNLGASSSQVGATCDVELESKPSWAN